MDSIKDRRSAAKTAVTIAARHVTKGIGVVEPSKLDELVSILDTAYLTLTDCNDDFRSYCLDHKVPFELTVVNGLTMDQYEKDIIDLVTNTKRLYKDSCLPVHSIPISNNKCSARNIIPMKFSGLRKDWPEFKRYWLELSLPAFGPNSILCAKELKEACKGGLAFPEVQNVSLGASNSYSLMWQALCDTYDNVVMAVSSAMSDLKNLKTVKEDDFRGTVDLIRQVESVYLQLDVLKHVDFVSSREVASIVCHLPPLLTREWAERHLQLSPEKQLRPFSEFYSFLKSKMPMLKYLSDNKEFTSPSFSSTSNAFTHKVKENFSSQVKNTENCLLHPNSSHNVTLCKKFLSMTPRERKEIIALNKKCFRCLSHDHLINSCNSSNKCQKCNKDSHHTLLCFANPNNPDKSQQDNNKGDGKIKSYATMKGSTTLYAIYKVDIPTSSETAIVFCDDGSEVSFISKEAVKRLNPRKLKSTEIEIVTLNNSTQLATNLWEVIIISTSSGKKTPVVCYEMPTLTGDVAQLSMGDIASIFPGYDPDTFKRPSGKVDILLGADYFSLHPKYEVASDGHNLSIMKGELGLCLQGTHPRLAELTTSESLLGGCVRIVESNLISCVPSLNSFVQGEELGTLVNPKCGGCRCGKCPLVGHHYSFREEQELKQIQSNLRYDSQNEFWVSSYPWIVDPQLLPNNYYAAFATLRNIEKRLLSEPSWQKKYSDQIQDMVDRGVARKLSPEEIKSWKGPVFYISHLAVENPKSDTTPVRIVFNSSQQFKGISLNSFLAKGPDSFKASLLGILLRFRENPIVIVGDIRKMYNSVHLEPLEEHTHRFLWRNCEDRIPDIWVITRVNMGDKPAGAIAIEAKDLTAELFKDISPAAAATIKESTYVDDIIDSVLDLPTARELCSKIECILKKGGFFLKEWKFGGIDSGNPGEVLQILGILYDALGDFIVFRVTLNFSKKKRGIRSGPCLLPSQVPSHLPSTFTRRVVLEQVMGLYDPLGLLSPFLLMAKIYLRETWTLKLAWDDPLSPDLNQKWARFFSELFQIEQLNFPRCLTPADAIGSPQLVILSDGSELAYGCAAYIRWKLSSGSFWCRLIMSKCRIAPLNRVSIPQMELNGAVLSKRIRKIIESETRFKFSHIYQLIDSETVLSMLHKVSTRFKVYEGVRLGEIQSATNGDLSAWGWIPGKCNIADWVTRQHSPIDLGPNSTWYKGPEFLYTPICEWNVNFIPSKLDNLPGEKKLFQSNMIEVSSSFSASYSRCSSLTTIEWALARVLSCLRSRSFKGGKRSNVTPDILLEVNTLLVKDMQSEWTETEVKNCFRTLMPVLSQGLWVVGTRISHHSPLTPDNKPHILLQSKHPFTKLSMKRAHEMSGHKGRDTTLARFRAKYWTSHASRLSKSICSSCQKCKFLNAKTLSQVMGPMPVARLTPSPPFSSTMIDLFGPVNVRGEVQKRTTGKAWGVVFTDLCCRAVHIEVACGYDTQSFLLTLQRFTSIRGWPVEIFSDPGTQLKASADIVTECTHHGTTWNLSPPDSPWRQGAVEALIKSIKKAFMLSIGNQRLSIPELLTALSDIANILNERPIGYVPGTDSLINILTPNSLLLGRSCSINPGGYNVDSQSLYSRLTLIKGVQCQFWKHWVELFAPTLVKQNKWKTTMPNLKVGDVVMVMEDPLSLSKAQYKLARVVEATQSSDGLVRSVKIAYKNFRVGEKVTEYSGVLDKVVERSVQRLVLIDSIQAD